MTDDSAIDDAERDFLDLQMTEFKVYIGKAEPFLKKFKDDLAGYLTKK